MHTILLLLLAILPGLYYVYRYYSKDIYRKEPIPIIVKSFLWGAVTIIPAAIIELALKDKLPKDNLLLLAILDNFLVVALTEEVCKLLAIRFYSYRNAYFDEMMDGVVYGAAVGGGFATFENILYVLNNGFVTGIIRALISVPSHIMWGAIIGHFLAKAKFQNKSMPLAIISSLFITVSLHGLFDFSIEYGDKKLIFFLPIIVILLTYIVNRNIKYALEFDKDILRIPFVPTGNPNPITTEGDNPNPTIAEGNDVIKLDNSNSIEEAFSSVTYANYPYLFDLLRAGSIMVGIIFIFLGAFLGLGFIIIFLEGKQKLDGWEILLVIIPVSVGGYFLKISKKWKSDEE